MASVLLKPSDPGWKSQWRIDLEASRAKRNEQDAQLRIRKAVSRHSGPPIAKLRECKPGPPKQTVSRQTRWQRQQVEQGNCRTCGRVRDGKSTVLCEACSTIAAGRWHSRAKK